MDAAGFVIELRHAAQGLYVQFGVTVAIEAPGHEMRASSLFQQVARRHDDSRRGGHQMVRVLDPAIALRLAQLTVLADAVELQQPVLEARRDVELPGTDLVRERIPGNRRFCPGAARRGAY